MHWHGACGEGVLGKGTCKRRGADRKGLEERGVLMLVLGVVYWMLHNTVTHALRACVCVCVCVCLVASHWETGMSVKGKGCP